MQVSFGAIKSYTEGYSRTRRQAVAEDIIDQAIRRKTNTKTGRDIVEDLERKKDSDFVIVSKRNGNIQLSVQKNVSSEDGDCFMPYDAQGKKRLNTEIKLKKLTKKSEVWKQVAGFIDLCRQYAEKPNCKKNESIERNIRRKAENRANAEEVKLTPDAEKYLARIKEEDDFDREFGINGY